MALVALLFGAVVIPSIFFTEIRSLADIAFSIGQIVVRAALGALSVFSVGAASIYFLMAFAALKELSICTGFAFVCSR